jgi:hypothetical protein
LTGAVRCVSQWTAYVLTFYHILYYVLYYTLAAFGGFTAAVRLLVDSGADPDKRDKDGWTALRYILYYILYYTPDKRDKDGWTALRLASRDANASSYSRYSASRDARVAATLALALWQAVLQLVYSCKRTCFTSTRVAANASALAGGAAVVYSCKRTCFTSTRVAANASALAGGAAAGLLLQTYLLY